MWKKENENPQNVSPVMNRNPVDQLKEKATIGTSIQIKGELGGEEDLVIYGQVEGKISLKRNNITIGKTGTVKADVYGKIISVEGEVEGNLFGEEKIIIRESGVVRGNLTAPRVNLEDGSKFKGSIDMDSQGEKQRPLVETRKEQPADSKAKPSSPIPQEEPVKGKNLDFGVKTGSSPSKA